MTISLSELARETQSRRRSAVETVRGGLSRIEAVNGSLHAMLSIDGDGALARAAEIDAVVAKGGNGGPLAGVPLAVKDNISTASGTTTCGSRILSHYAPVYRAAVVERLERAGAIVIGKTNLDEFAMGSSTENSAWGPTANPWDPSRVCGGSSGGSAAAVAAGLVPAAFGSDTGGSIRQPASFCGVVGLKPSYGRVSRYGLVAFGSSLDQIGPIATTVEDAALLLGIIAGHDDRDSTSVNVSVPDYLSAVNRPPTPLRIGLIDEHFGPGLDDDVRSAVLATIDALQSQGAVVEHLAVPHLRYAVACYYIVSSAEASSNLARYDGVHYGTRAARPADIIDLYARSRGEGFGAEVKRRIMLGTYVLSSGYYDAYYLKALQVRTLIKRDLDAGFERVDVIASPTAPTTAFRLGEKCDDPLAMYLSDVYTIPANLAGICAISLPCGFDRKGLPIGLQLMGPAFGEETLLAAAKWCERIVGRCDRQPSLRARN